MNSLKLILTLLEAGKYPALLQQGFVVKSTLVDIHLVKKIITAAVVLQRELISEIQIPFSDTLAGELKDQVKAYVSNERCEELHKLNIGGISEQHAARLKEELHVYATGMRSRAVNLNKFRQWQGKNHTNLKVMPIRKVLQT